MRYPIDDRDARISSPFGIRKHPVTGAVKLHNGIDIAVPSDTPVFSPAGGTVSGTLTNSVGGKQLIVNHSNGLRTGYAHLNKVLVSKGQKLRQGQKIALSGATGNVTGPHLHFTMKRGDEYLDPQKMIYTGGEGTGEWLKWVMVGGALLSGAYLYNRYVKEAV